MPNKTDRKLDRIDRNILATLHLEANLTNVELAERVGLSPSACLQRVKGLRDEGYFIHFHCEVDLDRICENVMAYVEFTLDRNDNATRKKVESAILEIPQFMDCFRLGDDVDYISFACCNNAAELTEICDGLSEDKSLGIRRINTRILLGRTKWFLGYPIAHLKWIEE